MQQGLMTTSEQTGEEAMAARDDREAKIAG